MDSLKNFMHLLPHQTIPPTTQRMVGGIIDFVCLNKIVKHQIPSSKDVDVYVGCDVHGTSVL